MADSIPLRYAQSLLRLAPMSEQELRQELMELKLPLVLLQSHSAADARIPVEDYGRLFIHIVRKLQQSLPSRSADIESTLLFSAYRMMFQAMLHASTLQQAMQRASVYFQRLQAHGETFHLEDEGDLVRCRFDFSNDGDADLQSPENFSMEQLNWLPGLTGHILSMAMWHRVCGWFIGSFITLEKVEIKQTGKHGKDGKYHRSQNIGAGGAKGDRGKGFFEKSAAGAGGVFVYCHNREVLLIKEYLKLTIKIYFLGP